MFKITFYVLVCLLTVSCSLGPVAVLRHALEIMDKYYHKNESDIEQKVREKKTVMPVEEDEDYESENEDDESEDEDVSN
ncbi:hypothetical protein DB313_04580 (plasmid) [Borrelia turcica IST7]|uniref:Lipoprotein n=1 Tax=Borrelia turcica IST7 TaxID=1104446 RepID=A0A386PPH7_9SPIR|nr:hypothetical protein [Borrelia turcica]AYE36777.1 hypothetical protein DB313_04580 [Borrelia turcica IST7]